VTATVRPRLAVLPASAILLAAACAWFGVILATRRMGAMSGTMGVGIAEFAGIWTLMMAAMMLPSVVPFASLYVRTIRGRRPLRLAALVAGYLAVWCAAAVPAFGLAWVADRVIDGHPGAATALAVGIFAACGVYQLTPIKDRCLARCRSPIGFVFKFASYRGPARDVRVGLSHGGFCLACCWSLMALLIAFGLMNVLAMIVLTAFVLAEKLGPWPRRTSQVLGVAALGLAVLVLAVPAVAVGMHQMPPSMAGMTHMGAG
jgi:predicted metal-binding membrane protein